MEAWQATREGELQAEQDRAAARGGQYAQVIEIGPFWNVGAPHLANNGSRAFVACLAGLPGRDGTYVNVVSPADAAAPRRDRDAGAARRSRFSGPSDGAMSGHPLHGNGAGLLLRG